MLWVLVLNATTGDLIDSHPEGVAMSADACVKAMVEKGTQPVRDGKATVYVCYNMAKSTKDIRI